MNLTDIYRMFHPNTKEYVFYAAVHLRFSKSDCILRHKTNLNKIRKIKTTPCILSDHNIIKPKINSKQISRNYTNSEILKIE